MDMLPRYTLRIPRSLLMKIKYTAKYNGRSRNKEIEMCIKEHISYFERENGVIDIDFDDEE